MQLQLPELRSTAAPPQDGCQYRCSQCGCEYQGGECPTLIPAQHAWVLLGGPESQTGRAGPAPAAGSDVTLMFGQWPTGTDKRDWIAEMQALHKPVTEPYRYLSLEQTTLWMIDELRRYCIPAVIKRMRLTCLATEAICEHNVRATHRQDKFFAVPQADFFGTVVCWDPPHTPVMSPSCVTHMITLATVHARRLLSQI